MPVASEPLALKEPPRTHGWSRIREELNGVRGVYNIVVKKKKYPFHFSNSNNQNFKSDRQPSSSTIWSCRLGTQEASSSNLEMKERPCGITRKVKFRWPKETVTAALKCDRLTWRTDWFRGSFAVFHLGQKFSSRQCQVWCLKTLKKLQGWAFFHLRGERRAD